MRQAGTARSDMVWPGSRQGPELGSPAPAQGARGGSKWLKTPTGAVRRRPTNWAPRHCLGCSLELSGRHLHNITDSTTCKKQLGAETREGFLKMYNSFCAQTPPPNPAVCSDESLKKVFERFNQMHQSANKPSATPVL